jgi:hypothetical protein
MDEEVRINIRKGLSPADARRRAENKEKWR